MLNYIIKFFKRIYIYNQNVSELSSLSDHELTDIGISRCDIYRIAKENMNKIN
jgi:uncharacterized protein YjiS (DUF1127 family)